MPTEIPVADLWPPPYLIRAARGLVGIDQATLAEYAHVSRKAIVALENDESVALDYRRVAVLEKVCACLEKRGVEFIKAVGGKGEGVRLSRPKRR
ncbi:helix-turn-helix domain-containing protein [Bradyrhizobium sp. WSM471]|uniref:helix-turn-helix domain-containing protein n=1 Tax=Bradyrhizobium sp. WSM471 TaxID=319017 RepID=UPI00024D1995|nr:MULTISPECIES: helix-turn-helix domain-containing protein [Bradyrhizobium]EHR00268.1 putative transcriptional regulator [Bradyrhizobium sp. WSM471]UFW42383.1 helix-turn-helix domain-containing protein [Bradyrhizobium canariense]